jgi:hypothetical protein
VVGSQWVTVLEKPTRVTRILDTSGEILQTTDAAVSLSGLKPGRRARRLFCLTLSLACSVEAMCPSQDSVLPLMMKMPVSGLKTEKV